jgi:hypothetical protein
MATMETTRQYRGRALSAGIAPVRRPGRYFSCRLLAGRSRVDPLNRADRRCAADQAGASGNNARQLVA